MRLFLKKVALVLEDAFATIIGLSICFSIVLATVGVCVWLVQWILKLLGVM